ncbi:hypothetical protein [Porphyromonas endodontalis]|uniref:hypothetical protein n=1 Tax=Porphyromonas endodontalis TaxID=28124 RepID=UPI0026EF85CA|nr:hypothetical protein [Porphyromonas endodontalis]
MKYYPKTRAFILFSLSILGAALLLSYKKEGKETVEEKVDQTTLQRSKANHKSLKRVIDSTYSDWHVTVQKADIKTKHNRVDTKLLVTISKRGKTLFNKEVITPSILAPSLDNHLQLTSVYIKGITNTTVYISLEAFSRETDGENYFILAFSQDGLFKKYRRPLSLDDSDFIVDFYIMYTHENLQKSVDKASLQKIAKAYGTSNFVAQLEKNGPLSIYPPEVIFRYKLDVEIETNTLEDYDDAYECCRAFFFPKDKDNPIGSMDVEIKATEGADGVVFYNRIDKISR